MDGLFDWAAMAAGLGQEWEGACGARTRDGRRCQGIPVANQRGPGNRNGRCRMHGGTSTGPTTLAGKAAIAASNRRRAAARRARATA